jgi:hypothetical protein
LEADCEREKAMSSHERRTVLLSRRQPPPAIAIPTVGDGQVRVDLSSMGSFPQHLLFYHMAKTGGTSLRELVAKLAEAYGMTIQVAYDGALGGRLSPFNRTEPARVVYGHRVTFNFHRLLPRAASYTYVAMLREPVSWLLSMFIHYHQNTVDFAGPRLGYRVRAWLNASIVRCPALLRQRPRASATAIGCSGELRYWHPFDDSVADGGGGCTGVVQRWVGSGALFLVFERFDASTALLSRLFARRARHHAAPSPLASSLLRRNVRARDVYDNGRLSLSDVASIGVATSATTCLQDIYVAAQHQFESSVLLP